MSTRCSLCLREVASQSVVIIETPDRGRIYMCADLGCKEERTKKVEEICNEIRGGKYATDSQRSKVRHAPDPRCDTSLTPRRVSRSFRTTRIPREFGE